MGDDDLPSFAATRELVYQHGDQPSIWLMFGLMALFFATFTLATADAFDAPIGPAVASIGLYGVWMFAFGSLWGVIWSDLRDDARERHGGVQ